MTADNYPAIQCDGPETCGAEITHPFAKTVTELRRRRAKDGWHTRPKGRDICPNCWKDGHR